MPESNLSFFGRLSLAVGTFFSVLGNREFAAGVQRVRDGAPASAQPAPVAAPVKPAAPELREASPQAALQLLGLLQSRPMRTPRSAPPRGSCTTAAAPRCANTSRSFRCATRPRVAA